jgi:WD40 repeat protein
MGRLWDGTTGRLIRELPRHSTSQEVIFSFGKNDISTSYDKIHQLWDLATGQPIGEPLCVAERIMSVKISSDEKTIMVHQTADNWRISGVHYWDIASRQRVTPPLDDDGRPVTWITAQDGSQHRMDG